MRTADTTLNNRNAARARRWGRAKATIRRRVAPLTVRRGCSPCMTLSSAIQLLNPMSTATIPSDDAALATRALAENVIAKVHLKSRVLGQSGEPGC